MITLDDCMAFCEVDSLTVETLARTEHLGMAVAVACAHSRTLGSEGPGGSASLAQPDQETRTDACALASKDAGKPFQLAA